MPFEIEMAQSAVGVLQNHEGRILIVRRSLNSKIDPGKWELPKGKVRRPKESPEEAIEREFAEETGISVKVSRLLLTEKISVLGLSIKMLVYEVKPVNEQLQVRLSDEHQAHAWISPTELDDYDFGLAMRGIIQAAFEKLGYPQQVAGEMKETEELLELGKIPPKILAALVSYTGWPQPGAIELPSIGRDCFVGNYEEGITKALQFYGTTEQTCHFVVKADPITFPTPEPGKYAVIVNGNDLATTGAVPYGMTLTMLLPRGTRKKEVLRYQNQAHDAARELNLMILGGHSEVTEAVTTPVVSASMIGFVPPSKYINRPVESGDLVLALGHVAAEGTGILAAELRQVHPRILQRTLGTTTDINSLLQRAEEIGRKISIINALLQLNREITIKQAHDATEGGVFGALWEFHQRLTVGMKIRQSRLPIDQSTLALSRMLQFNPYRLISSGLVLFITSPDEIKKIESWKEVDGMPVTQVGVVTDDIDGVLIEETGEVLSEPQPDDLIIALQAIDDMREPHD